MDLFGRDSSRIYPRGRFSCRVVDDVPEQRHVPGVGYAELAERRHVEDVLHILMVHR